MPNFKLSRLNEDIRRELSTVLCEVKDPRVRKSGGMLSIVKVSLSNDLSYCKVYVSSLDGLEAAQEAVEGLKSAAGLIRHEVCSRVQMRKAPQFIFIADDSIAHSAHIDQLLHNIHLGEDDTNETETDGKVEG